MNRSLLILLGTILLLTGCKSDKTDPEPLLYGFDYYPVAVGDYKIYEITDVKQLGDSTLDEYEFDTTRYQIRETIDSAFTDLAGEEFFRVFRYRRATDADAWVQDSVITIKRTNARLERVENNKREVKLVFPMSEGRSWNVNMLNADPEKTYRYHQIGGAYLLKRPNQDTTFANTVLVRAISDSSAIQVNRHSDRYALNVGLIETITESIYFDDMQIGSGLIEQARYKTRRLIESGSR